MGREHPGYFPGAVRFICHGITGSQALISIGIYATLRKHDQIRHPPFSPRVLPVQAIAGVGGILFFAWNFFTWLPMMATTSRTAVFLFGLVDAVFTVMTIVQLVLQPAYITLSMQSCHNSESFGVAPGSPSVFMLAAGYNGTMDASKSDQECKYFISAWALAFVTVVLYSASVVYSLSPFFGCIFDLTTDLYKRGHPVAGCKRFVKFVIRGIAALIPRCIKARFRFLCRYMQKSRHQTKAPPMSEKQWSIRHRNPEWNGEKMEKILGFDILMLIARDLHYSDILNLSLTSKTVYNAVFPKNEIYERIKFLRKYTCDDEYRSSCWICSLLICSGCNSCRQHEQRSMAKHIETCQPHCSKCYIKVTASEYSHQATCTCNGTGYHPTRLPDGTVDHHWRWICKFCWALSDEDIVRKRNLLQQSSLKKQVEDLDRCSRCSVPFKPDKPKWWVCSGCYKECRSNVHLGWTCR